MTGNKINSNPSFDTDADTIIEKEEVIEPVEDDTEETTPEVENENEDSPEDPSDGKNEPLEPNEDDEKKRALAGLLNEEEKLRKDESDLDIEIAKVKERIKGRRSNRREKREIIEKVQKVIPIDDEVDDLSDIDETTLGILERFTKAKGLVPKAELEAMEHQKTHKSAEENFYATHKEYLPENDTNDELYNALKEELALYVRPTDPKLIAKLFEKAHMQVAFRFPNRFTQKSNPAADAARAQKKAVATIGGGQSSGASSKKAAPKTALSDKQIQIMREGGWTDEEINNL